MIEVEQREEPEDTIIPMLSLTLGSPVNTCEISLQGVSTYLKCTQKESKFELHRTPSI